MTDIEEISDRLDGIEASIGERPGDAQTELEAVMPAIGEILAERQADAQQLLRNEDLAGAAHILVENGVLFQRSAILVLELREEIRRRR